MATARTQRITYTAPILGGYEMTADMALAEEGRASGWRLIAIPGTPSRPHMFSRMLKYAPPDLDVIVPNRAGYGGPMYGDGVRAPVFDFDDQVKAIAPLFEKDDGKRTIALGVSYGGELALKCALDYPDHIAGAMTVAMLVREPRDWVRAIMPLADAPGIKQALPGYLHNSRAEVAARRPQIGPLFDRLKTMIQPVTILHGDLDTLVPQSDALYLKGLFAPEADVDYVPIKGGTHYLELQRPQLIYRELRALIARAEKGVKTSDKTKENDHD